MTIRFLHYWKVLVNSAILKLGASKWGGMLIIYPIYKKKLQPKNAEEVIVVYSIFITA